MIGAELGKANPLGERYPARSPRPQALRSEAVIRGVNFRTNRVDQRAIGVLMSGHEPFIHAALIADKGKTLLSIHSNDLSNPGMVDLSPRIRQRIDELRISQAEAARASGCSAARFGNYVSGTRKPDLETLVRIARALRTTTDWLLGVSEVVPIDTKAVFLRLLELEGMPRERAVVLAEAADEALRLLSALPDEGDARTRAVLAAQAAWQMRSSSKPS